MNKLDRFIEATEIYWDSLSNGVYKKYKTNTYINPDHIVRISLESDYTFDGNIIFNVGTRDGFLKVISKELERELKNEKV